MDPDKNMLIVNAGSSSIKISLYAADGSTDPYLHLEVDGIGQQEAYFRAKGNNQDEELILREASDHAVVAFLHDWLTTHIDEGALHTIGHRIVHGGTRFCGPERLTPNAVEDLRAIQDLDPDHLPLAIKCIEMLASAFANIHQIGCFDTAFYSDMPRLAHIVPIPRKYEVSGVKRYGFHGLSYEFLLSELSRRCGEEAARGRVILAHMGSGVSLTATKNGKPVDTTMGFTPSSGVMMSTRSGDVDPGLALYMQRKLNMSPEDVNQLLSKESGLLGVSELSADMYQLLQAEGENTYAAEAVNLFCYQVRKMIGALSTTLGGLDTVVFSGGMGENAPKIRERVLADLQYLGVELDDERNQNGEECISRDGSQVGVHVLHTDENQVILRHIEQLLTEGQ
jgi:acetate kinase